MRPRKLAQRLGLVVGMVMALTLIAPQAANATTSAEKYSHYLINRVDRMPRGLRPLYLNEYISTKARSHSYAMARAGKIYHSNLNVMATRIANWRVIGENVGVGPDLKSINRAFMNSPSHRANLLCKCFRYVGVGVVQARGYYWVTHVFWG